MGLGGVGRGGGAGTARLWRRGRRGGGGFASRCRKLTEARQLTAQGIASLGFAEGAAKMNINGAFQPFQRMLLSTRSSARRTEGAFYPHLTDEATAAQGERQPSQGRARPFPEGPGVCALCCFRLVQGWALLLRTSAACLPVCLLPSPFPGLSCLPCLQPTFLSGPLLLTLRSQSPSPCSDSQPLPSGAWLN